MIIGRMTICSPSRGITPFYPDVRGVRARNFGSSGTYCHLGRREQLGRWQLVLEIPLRP